MRFWLILLLLCPPVLLAQHRQELTEGHAIYRSNCAFCHGLTGRGGRGPALTEPRAEEELRQVIRNGIPGTGMPAFETMEPAEVDTLVEFLRGFRGGVGGAQPVAGDPQAGRAVYQRNGCAACHRVEGQGSDYGPDLSRIGAARSADYIRESITHPNADVPPEFEGVAITTREGRTIAGLRVNEDTFSVQLRDPAGRLHMFEKSALAGVRHETRSLMPAYNQLPARDLQNLLAYLDRQRGHASAAGFAPVTGGVTYQRLVNALAEPHDWLTYWGDYSGRRHRALDQINTANVQDLRVEWIFQTGVPGAFEAVPLVVDGVMYFTTGESTAFAIDARSGRQLWRYKHAYPPGRKAHRVNRGFAMLGDRLFMVTGDANLLALDSRTGRLIWQTEITPYKAGTYYATLAPLAVKDKIIVGISGGEEGTRGFIDAYSAADGRRAWRFWTIPAAGEPGSETWKGDSWMRGGGPAWMTGTFDPQLNTLYWGIGNPGPDLYGGDRPGDNLYTDSLVALDPDTGKLKWHFQFTPHDTHDWDACETPVLIDLEWKGRPRKLVVQANRNAHYYVLDRETGEFLFGTPFARQSWAKGLDARGRPIVLPNTEPSPEGTRVCPGLAGAANWMAPSFNPQTGLFYVPVREQCDVYYSSQPKYIEGKPYWGSVFRGVTDEKEWGELKALDPRTGETRWSFRYYKAPWAGTLSTSGGLILAGEEDGYIMAFDAKTGENLWKFNTGSRIVNSPITWMQDGRQYVTVPSGAALLTFALPPRLN